MESKATKKSENGSGIPGVEAKGTTTAIKDIGTQEHKKVPCNNSRKCGRYQEDALNPDAGAGLCFVPDNGFGKTVPTCSEMLRQGRCRYGYHSPYIAGAARRKPVAPVIDADTMQAQAEARIRGCGV